MRKYKTFYNFDKEEAWLRKMAQQGWLFFGRSFFGGYDFVQSDMQDMNYRIDFRNFKNATDFSDYVALFETSGWHHVWGSKSSGAQYFVKLREDAGEDIFSDNASKLGRYQRCCMTWLPLLLSFTLCFIPFILNNSMALSYLFNPKSAYLTPGLWEKAGKEFWLAFLFETPFALGRMFSWLVVLVALLMFIYMMLRYLIELYRQKKSL